jgi:hypothetical protein
MEESWIINTVSNETTHTSRLACSQATVFILHALSYEFALMSKKSIDPSTNDYEASGSIWPMTESKTAIHL